MTNLEYYKDELKDRVFREKDIHIEICAGAGISNFVREHLKEINFNGNPSRFIEWLLEEYKETNKIILHEKYVLESICSEYKYLARDENGLLWAFVFKPYKSCHAWISDMDFCRATLFNHLFQFINWKDSEPYKIKDILNNFEVIEND